MKGENNTYNQKNKIKYNLAYCSSSSFISAIWGFKVSFMMDSISAKVFLFTFDFFLLFSKALSYSAMPWTKKKNKIYKNIMSGKQKRIPQDKAPHITFL